MNCCAGTEREGLAPQPYIPGSAAWEHGHAAVKNAGWRGAFAKPILAEERNPGAFDWQFQSRGVRPRAIEELAHGRFIRRRSKSDPGWLERYWEKVHHSGSGSEKPACMVTPGGAFSIRTSAQLPVRPDRIFSPTKTLPVSACAAMRPGLYINYV